MAKNLVILHLESVSNTLLWQYRLELGTIWRLMQESQWFTNFITNATSTRMSMNALLSGSTAENDNYSHYNDSQPPDGRWKDLGMYLAGAKEKGYVERIYTLDYYFRRNSVSGRWHTYNNTQMLFSSMRDYVGENTAAGQPFFLYFNDQVSHMALDNEAKMTAPTFSERFRQSYRSLDADINQLLVILTESNAWDNTVIVAVGDHGDEMWSHGLNRGYCHGIAPYASLTRTPLAIYEAGAPARIDDRLLSMADLMETLTVRLLGDTPDISVGAFRTAPFSGINVDREKRDLVFCQNLYALQLEYDDPEKGMTKGYAVTDGIYRLVVSSGGNKPRDGGLEFYCDSVDPTNSRNLLDFFILGVDGEPVMFRPPPEADAPEFAAVFNPEAVRHLTATYSRLRRALHDHVREKERIALGRPHHAAYQLMPERAFTNVRRRMRRD